MLIPTLLLSLAAAAPPAANLAERYVFTGKHVLVETTVARGQTVTKRLEEDCTSKGDGRVRCTTRDPSGKEPPWYSESLVTDNGLYALGGGDSSGFTYVMSPPALEIPATAAIGSKWSIAFDTTFTEPGQPPTIVHARKRGAVTASKRCAGGLMVTATKRQGDRRSESESLYCPGMPAPVAVIVRLFKKGALTSTIVSTFEGVGIAPAEPR